LRCDQENGLRKLVNAGVRIGLSNAEFSSGRNLRWEAGMVRELGGLSYQAALATVTSNLASFFGLHDVAGRIAENRPANFVVYDGDVLSLDSHILGVALKNEFTCKPQQNVFPIK
jgi:imidazolonepropionase-like amidohydrolase